MSTELQLWDKIKESTKKNALGIVGGAIAAGGALAGGSIEATTAGVMTIISSVQQRKLEENYEEFKKELEPRITTIEQNLGDHGQKIKQFNKALSHILRYVIEEPQRDKIACMVNGLENISKQEKIKEDFVLLYYDTLKELRILDILILNNYYGQYFEQENNLQDKQDETILDVLDITYKEYTAVCEKLVRMGLLQDRQDLELEKIKQNMVIITRKLQGKRNTKKLKRLSKVKGYVVTRFGLEFMKFFINQDNELLTKKA